MKFDIKAILVIAVAIVMGAFTSWVVFHDDEVSSDTKADGRLRVVKTARGVNVKKITEIKIGKKDGRRAVTIVESEEEKPNLLSGKGESEDDDEKLTKAQRALMKELQDALDRNNLRDVRRVLAKFAKNAKSCESGEVPKCMRMDAVSALGWFGKDAALDLMGYMADVDPDVSNDAFSQFEMALQDYEMSDRERSSILMAALKAISDPEMIDSLLNNLMEMRNSVKVATIKAIYKSGTDTARTMLMEQIGIYTDADVETIDDVDKWSAMNQDDPGDEDFYGGQK